MIWNISTFQEDLYKSEKFEVYKKDKFVIYFKKEKDKNKFIEKLKESEYFWISFEVSNEDKLYKVELINLTNNKEEKNEQQTETLIEKILNELSEEEIDNLEKKLKDKKRSLEKIIISEVLEEKDKKIIGQYLKKNNKKIPKGLNHIKKKKNQNKKEEDDILIKL